MSNLAVGVFMSYYPAVHLLTCGMTCTLALVDVRNAFWEVLCDNVSVQTNIVKLYILDDIDTFINFLASNVCLEWRRVIQ